MGGDIVFLIPIVALLSTAAIFLANSPIAKALAKRAGGEVPDESLQQAFDEQAARLTMAEDEIEKLGERLDFTERLIAGRPAAPALTEAGEPTFPPASPDERSAR